MYILIGIYALSVSFIFIIDYVLTNFIISVLNLSKNEWSYT